MNKTNRTITLEPGFKIKGARVTERDMTILQFINDFGFCEMRHLEKRFGLRGARSYQITNKLKIMGLLLHEYVFYNRPGIFRLTHEGAKLTSLPRLHKVQMANYRHHLAIFNVYFHLRERFTHAAWTGERQLIHNKNWQGIGKEGHVPDGMLVIDNKKIAIEIELTLKGAERFNDILTSYLKCPDYTEVWYYAKPGVVPTLAKLANDLPFVRIFPIEEFLA